MTIIYDNLIRRFFESLLKADIVKPWQDIKKTRKIYIPRLDLDKESQKMSLRRRKKDKKI